MKQKRNESGRVTLALFSVVSLVFVYTLSTIPVQRALIGTTSQLANAVGVFAGVPTNPYNTLAAELALKEAELSTREALLAAEQNRSTDEAASLRALLIGSFVVSGIVLVLVILNFYLDYRRRNKNRRGTEVSGAYSVNLKE